MPKYGGPLLTAAARPGQSGSGAGLLWLSDGGPAVASALTGRRGLTPPGVSSGQNGIDYWFCDFNQTQDYSISGVGGFVGAVGTTDDAVGIPNLGTVGTATAASIATTNNVPDMFTWGRTANIGTPANFTFNGLRASGTGNELHSSLRINSDTNASGTALYQPFAALGQSTSLVSMDFGFISRFRISAIANGAHFLGFSNVVLGGTTVLSAAGAALATAADTYIGFRVDTSGNINAIINAQNVSQNTFDTGLDVSNNIFAVVEMRGNYGNNNVAFADLYVNGRWVRPSGSRAHTFISSDFASFASTAIPISPTMAYVRVGGAVNLDVDYIGMWNTRVLGPAGLV